MTDLRDAAEVAAMDIWQQAKEAYYVEPLVVLGAQLPSSKDEAAAAIIEADRAATRAEERAKVVGEIVARLKEENGLCDCFAHDPRECACGAWDDYKSMSLERVWGLIEQEFSHE